MESDQDLRLLTPPELAAFLRVPQRTIYSWRYRGLGPTGIRVGRHLRFRLSEVDTWLDRHTDASQRVDVGVVTPAESSGPPRGTL